VHAEQDAKDEGANGQGHAERLEVAFQFGVVGVGFGFHGLNILGAGLTRRYG
jgi:hypothetical protein